ncbi:MAG: hypothetical protein ACI9VM_000420 [Candidatus Azotimanducaceae bacterium]|jgi:hypothetical protein
MSLTDLRSVYFDLLKKSLNTSEFYCAVAQILDQDSFFFPAYLEMLWRAEERGDHSMYRKLLFLAKQRLFAMYVNRDVQKNLKKRWSKVEIDAALEIIDLIFLNSKRLFMQYPLLYTIKITLPSLFQECTVDEILVSDNHLKLVANVDVSDLKKELSSLSLYWWQINTGRQEQISHHAATKMICLRSGPEDVEYTPVDGVHESRIAAGGHKLKKLHAAIVELATELHIGLGRVGVVELAPQSQVYRHYDAEKHLVGRKRYHLVLQCGADNILSSGNETVTAKEGDVWFFDNKALHRAHNKSDTPRIHVIFDGYPLS